MVAPQEVVIPIGSPVSWAGNYQDIIHTIGCPVIEIQTELNKSINNHTTGKTMVVNDRLATMLNSKAPGTSKPIHTQRLVCKCMDSFDFDKQVCLELMSRDLCTEAYAHLMRMTSAYPLADILKDVSLRSIAMQYLTLRQLYSILTQPAPCTKKATKQGQVYRPPEVMMPDIDGDILSQYVYTGEKVGLFGTLFDDAMEGKDLSHHKRNKQQLPNMYTVPWRAAVYEKDIKVWFRVFEGTRVDFRVEGLIDSSIHDLISIMSEVEMAKLWMPYLKIPIRLGLSDAKSLGRYGRFRKVSSYNVDLPYPLANIEALVQGCLTDDLDRNGKLVIGMTSFLDEASPAEKATWPLKFDRPKRGVERIDFGGGCMVEPYGKNACQMSTVWSMSLNEAPSVRLIEFVTSQFIKIAFNKFKKTVRDCSQKFSVARKQDPWLYGYVERRLEELAIAGYDPYMQLGDVEEAKKKRAQMYFRNERNVSFYHNDEQAVKKENTSNRGRKRRSTRKQANTTLVVP